MNSHTFFEKSDGRVEQLTEEYREETLLSVELKELAAERITDFLGITKNVGRRSVRLKRNCLCTD
jgi:tryptophanyl-tRNA synthetase